MIMKKISAFGISAMTAAMCLCPTAFAAEPDAVYDLWIADTRVTSENANDVLGDGSVIYDEENNLLMFTDDIEWDGDRSYAFAFCSIPGLTITATKDVTLSLHGPGFSIDQDTTFKTRGHKITIDSSDDHGYTIFFGAENIDDANIATLTFEDSDIVISGGVGNCICGNVPDYANESYLKFIGTNAHIENYSEMNAIQNFTDISFEGCSIVSPEDAVFENGTIYTENGSYAYSIDIAADIIDLADCDVNVDMNDKLVTVRHNGNDIRESEYTVEFVGVDNDFTGTEFPTVPGEYKVVVTAVEGSGYVTGTNDSATFTITAEDESSESTPESESTADSETESAADASSSADSSKADTSSKATSTASTTNPGTGAAAAMGILAVAAAGIAVSKKRSK
ncbi:MAG: hypothetical protein IJM87_06265 [Ruminococcus sp.]|nr:hypothetical protein [Ruminococcus sp.]